MRIAVAGATGFIGRHLTAALRNRGDEVIELSLRDPARAALQCEGLDAVVNLAGEPISQRWSPAVKERIADSRIKTPHAFIDGLAKLGRTPRSYISASAVGYYGTSETATFTENSGPGNDFLARVCTGWESEAERAMSFGMRVAIVRTGIALGTDGGALKAMLPPFQMGAGGIVGSGRQWYSWIHIDDVVGIYLMALDGATNFLNATAPTPVTNADFTQALGHALNRPTVVPVPTFALRMMLGEGADIVLTGQRVLPERTIEQGYRFKYTSIHDALASLL